MEANSKSVAADKVKNQSLKLFQYISNIKGVCMTKEVVKHRKDERKKPTLTQKEKKQKKQEKKAAKKSQ
jgi:hypothetical protein